MQYFHGIPLLSNEEFKEVVGYENRYHISNLGRLISLKGYPKILKVSKDSRGYYSTTLSLRTNKKMHLIHRLVATAFIPNPLNLPFINHIDGNSVNNTLSNLEWCTPKENCHHAISIGRSARGAKGKNNKSGYVGVSWDKWYQKWTAQISVFGIGKKLGFFDCKEDAARAYDKASLEFHGKTGRINF